MLTSTVVSGWESLQPLAADWDRLLRSCSNGVHGPDATNSFVWAQALARTHLSNAPMRTLVVRSQDEIVAIVPTYARLIGERLLQRRELHALTQAYSGRCGLLIRDNDSNLLEFCLGRLIKDVSRWDFFMVTVVEQSAAHRSLLASAKRLGLRTRSLDVTESPYIELLSSWDETLARLPKKMRWTIRKAEKDLSAKGELRYQYICDPEEAAQLPAQIYAVERKSWKEGTGTSITSHAAQQQFYDTAIALLAASGKLSAHVLRLDGDPIAYILGVCAGDGVFLDLKESFVAEYAEYSPGHVLKRFAMENLISRDVAIYDFMGLCEPYKMRWTDKTYRRATLVIYNTSLRGSLHYARSTLASRLARTRASKEHGNASRTPEPGSARGQQDAANAE